MYKYQYIIGCRIAFPETWHNNCKSGEAKKKKLDQI